MHICSDYSGQSFCFDHKQGESKDTGTSWNVIVGTKGRHGFGSSSYVHPSSTIFMIINTECCNSFNNDKANSTVACHHLMYPHYLCLVTGAFP